MDIKKIVVGVDFSPESEVAAKEALNIARHVSAEIVLVHVGNVAAMGSEAPSNATDEWQTFVNEQFKEDRAQLEQMRERLSGQGAEVSHAVIEGFPSDGLSDAAKQLDADLVVTGTHGRTGLARFLLGSVAEKTVRLCECAVLVARPCGSDGYGGYKRILVPTDFSDIADKALQVAIQLASDGAQIDLVHYWSLPMIGAGAAATKAEAAAGAIKSALRSEAEEKGAARVKKHQHDGVQITFSTVQAGAAHGIVDRVKDGGHDYEVVIMGSHGRRGLRRMVLGSVAETTVRHTACSVLVVHGDPPID